MLLLSAIPDLVYNRMERQEINYLLMSCYPLVWIELIRFLRAGLRAQELREMEREIIAEEAKNAKLCAYYHGLEAETEKLHQFSHDFRNQLNTASLLAAAGETSGLRLMEELKKELSKQFTAQNEIDIQEKLFQKTEKQSTAENTGSGALAFFPDDQKPALKPWFFLLMLQACLLCVSINVTLKSSNPWVHALNLCNLLAMVLIYAVFAAEHYRRCRRAKLWRRFQAERREASIKEKRLWAAEMLKKEERIMTKRLWLLLDEAQKKLSGEAGQGGKTQAMYSAEEEEVLPSERAYCSNLIINLIITKAAEKCSEAGIGFAADVQIPTGLRLTDAELCSLFGNLLDNAVEAALNSQEILKEHVGKQPLNKGVVSNEKESNPERKTVEPFVHVKVATYVSYLCIEVQNTADEAHVRRRKRDGHGLGKQIVRNIAKKYDGEMKAVYEKGVYRAEVTLLAVKADA